MKNKKIKIIIIGILILILVAVIIITIEKRAKLKRQKQAELEIGFQDEVEVEVYSHKKFEHIINQPEIDITSNINLDTSRLKKEKVTFKYVYNDEEFTKTVTVKVVDTTDPTIFANKTYTVTKGSDRNFLNYILSGDNYDNKPKRTIIGDYNADQVGTYPLTYHIEDSSGNAAEWDFKVIVKEPVKSPSSNNSSTTPSRIKFSDVLKKHKNEKTELGIDVSKWQGDIDFQKVKDAGCEFVIIRLGSQKGVDGELVIDPYFKKNIEKATEVGLKVGVYLYTYAKNEKDVIKQAKWVIKNVKDYELDLGIGYDWESWTNFNSLGLSYHHFTELANTFIKNVKKSGYNGMLYSSKYYLENIWTETNNDIWLAHYTTKTDYSGKYRLWQRTGNGSIDGIDTAVDIDILYKD